MENLNDTLVSFGSEIKALGTTEDGALKFGAWLVLFGDSSNTDASHLRDYFTKFTDFDIEDGDKTTVYYNHGLDPELKRRKLGTATLQVKDAGVWMEGQLKARDEYETKIQELIKKGKLGASSGVPAHLVERKNMGDSHEILLWPLGKDASLTPTPAEPRTMAHALKSLSELIEEDELKKFNPNQPRDEDGKFSDGATTIGGRHTSVTNKPISRADVHKVADSYDLSAGAREALVNAHVEGKLKTEAHLLFAIDHGKQRDKLQGHSRAQHYLDGVERHGVGGTHEGRKGEVSANSVGASRKSVDDEVDETKQLEILNDGLLDGLSFDDHSTKVLAAVVELQERIESLAEMRCAKSDRRWSVQKHELLTTLATGLTNSADAVKALADAHAPRARGTAGTIDSTLLDAELRFTQMNAELTGVLIPIS